MRCFWLALSMNFVAELGDKTQLVTLMFAARHKPMAVFWGVVAGTGASQAISALLGGLVGGLLPQPVVRAVAGLVFLGFGIRTLFGKDDEAGECQETGDCRSPFLMIATTYCLAEMGDKTMLGNIALAASSSPLVVFAGGSIGMLLSCTIAIFVGARLGRALPERTVKIGASAMFLGFGAWSIVGSWSVFSPASWVAAILTVTGLSLWLSRRGKRPEPSEVSMARAETSATLLGDEAPKERPDLPILPRQ